MAHFAKLDENNKVISVHVVNNNVITIDGIESEQLGIDFLTNLYGYNKWKQTSYNGNIRKNYAGAGYFYDEIRDAFIPPKPFDSWVFEESTCVWKAPVPYPTDGKFYTWNEVELKWDEVELPN